MARTFPNSRTGADTLQYRLHLNRLLGTADWQPPGMSPTAVLIVRHLTDPLPGQLAAHLHAVRAPFAWETAVQQQIANLHQQAARPHRGHLPPDAAAAPAVLFVDEAEMLACLALDAARGLAAGRWWWQALRRARPNLPLLEPVRLLLWQPRLTPAVFACLHDWGSVETVTAVLSPAQAADVLTAVLRARHLPPLATHPPDEPLAAAPDAVSAPVLPPWEPYLSPTAVSADLSPTLACLLGLSLSLTRRPAAVATPRFQRQLQTWWRAQHRQTAASPPDPASPARAAAPSQTAAPSRPDAKPEKEIADERPFAPPPSRATPLAARPTPHAPKPPQSIPPSTPPEPQTGSPPETAVPDATRPTPTPARETAVFPEDGLPTQLGGILYLINLMVRLDVPACYEAEWELASQVGAWGTLALLARGLLDPMPDHLLDDPIWAALAELNGRSPDQPHSSRRAHHAAWLAHALPDFRAHLLNRLRLDDPDDLTNTLLMANGRLHITTTHVDLVLPLAAISLPVRLAGLDFDPGWQPAFGRVIQFHFR